MDLFASRYRLFFALRPPLMVARRIDHFARSLALEGTHILPYHQHVTIGITADRSDYPGDWVEALRHSVRPVAVDPFDLRLDRVVSGRRSVALRPARATEGLKRLHEDMAGVMRRAGIAMRSGWRFDPHQTLFYGEGASGQRRIEGFGWRVEEVALICSHVGRTRHETLGIWPLEGSAQYPLL